MTPTIVPSSTNTSTAEPAPTTTSSTASTDFLVNLSGSQPLAGAPNYGNGVVGSTPASSSGITLTSDLLNEPSLTQQMLAQPVATSPVRVLPPNAHEGQDQITPPGSAEGSAMPVSGQDGGHSMPGADAGGGGAETLPAGGGGDAVETQPLAGETTLAAGAGPSPGATFAGTVAGSLASTLVGTVDLGSPVISAVVGGAVSGAVNTVVTQLVETGVMASAGSIASGALSGAGQGLISLGVGALTQGIDDPVISTVVNHVATNFVSNAMTGAANPFSAQGLLGADFGGSMLGGLLAKVVMPNGDPLGMSIGGMVGSAGAIALAGGMTALTAMGFVGAFLVPFAGAFLGALLGGAIGSIFGGNDAHVGMGSSGVYAADGSVTGYGVGGKRVAARAAEPRHIGHGRRKDWRTSSDRLHPRRNSEKHPRGNARAMRKVA